MSQKITKAIALVIGGITVIAFGYALLLPEWW